MKKLAIELEPGDVVSWDTNSNDNIPAYTNSYQKINDKPLFSDHGYQIHDGDARQNVLILSIVGIWHSPCHSNNNRKDVKFIVFDSLKGIVLFWSFSHEVFFAY